MRPVCPWAIAVCLLTMFDSVAAGAAVEDGTPSMDDVVIVGKRSGLETSQDIKRSKFEIVDSVAAEDINKLPDFNVTDALSRVTGVQILRDRGEGAGVAVRGLTQMETLFNGREMFTAGNGRNLDFADIPSEMLAGLDVYKTASANQLEGGIGGIVDLRTHKPFDFGGTQLFASGRMMRGDFVDEEEPQFSSLLSHRWQSETLGEFGALFSGAYQPRAWREDQHSFGNPKRAGSWVAPNGAIDTVTRGERERIGASLVLQWRPSDRWDLYAEAHHSRFKTRQDGYQLFVTPRASFDAGSVSPFPGTNDARSITWTNPAVSNWGSARDTVDRTSQLALGGAWRVGRMALKSDLSYTLSHNNLFYSVITRDGSAASLGQDIAGRGNTLTGVNFDKAGMVYAGRPFDGSLWAGRLDGEYHFGGRFIDKLTAGLRYAVRSATDAPGQVVFYKSNAVGLANASGLMTPSPYSAFPIGSPEAARDVESVRNTLGISAPIPGGNPLGTWTIDEDTRSTYFMANFKGGNLPVDGNFGLRAVETRERVSGYQTQSGGGISSIETDNTYLDLLPSMNLRYELAEGLLLRGAVSKSVARPDFNQLSPSLTLNIAQRNGVAGNPALRPVRADNFDIALEKYFDASTSVHLTGFYKQVEGFAATVSNPEVYGGVTYQVSRPQNTSAATIRGFEAGYQQFYDFLPAWLRGLGLQANYTFIDSKTASSLVGQNVPLQNLSRHSYNLAGIYEKGPISARIAYNWRDAFHSGIANIAGVGALPIYVGAYGWLDASLSYRFNEHLSFTLEGLNLLDTRRFSYFGTETRPQTVWTNDVQVGAMVAVKY